MVRHLNGSAPVVRPVQSACIIAPISTMLTGATLTTTIPPASLVGSVKFLIVPRPVAGYLAPADFLPKCRFIPASA